MNIFINYFLWLIPVPIASGFNSIMDTLAHHFPGSIFSKWNKNFWDASVSGNNKYIGGKKENGRTYWIILGFKVTIPSLFTDAWHPAKTLMLIAIWFAINLHKQVYPFTQTWWINDIAECALFGLTWCKPFSFLYNQVWLRDSKFKDLLKKLKLL